MSKKETNPTIFRLIKHKSPALVRTSIGLGLIAGLGYSLIVPLLLNVVGGGSSIGWMREHEITLYFGLCLLIFAAKAGSLICVTVVAKDVTADLRIRLCHKMNRISVRDLESVGMARITNMLVADVANISFAAVCLPMVSVQVITIAGLMCYLAYLDWKVFLCTMLAVGLGLAVIKLPTRISAKYMGNSRRLRDVVQDGIKGVVYGAYELKVNSHRAAHFSAEKIVAPELESARFDKMAEVYMHLSNTFIDLFSFFVIGIVAFVLPTYVSTGATQSIGVIMVLLYIIVPIAIMMAFLPNIQRGNIALLQLRQLEQLHDEPNGGEPIGDWSTYRVQDLQYRYHDATDPNTGFQLRPTSLEFKKGEIVFIVGGNGSGKSTLSKLLSLHYAADAGEIYFDERRVTSANLAAAREKIAVIYSNYHLFEQPYARHAAVEEEVTRYLKLLGLEGKTEYRNGSFSTIQLSDGQRRRLALLVALLDDRDIYVFDEWAADQDPEFREIFYTQILQRLKHSGKLVIAITHDDRYFASADRVVVMEYGGVRTVRQGTALLETRTAEHERTPAPGAIQTAALA